MSASLLSEAIMMRARESSEGEPIEARKLSHLGSVKTVGRALSRLARRGSLLRATRGVYVRPVEGKFGTRPPAAAKVAQALAASRGEVVASHGAAAANGLGLTTQVPMRTVLLTSGPNRVIDVGSQPVEMRHAPRWQLAHAGTRAGQVIRALEWLGPEEVPKAIETLRRHVPREELVQVSSVTGRLPTWLAGQVRAFA